MRVDSLVWVRDARDPRGPTAAEINAGARIWLTPSTPQPRPRAPRVRPPFFHVTRYPCPLKHCGWSGYHVHWRHSRFRSALRQMTPTELAEFDAACHNTWEEVTPDG